MSILETLRLVRKSALWYFSSDRDLRHPPAPIKRFFLRRIARKHGLRVFVETGTFQGGTIDAMRGAFRQIHSIELSAELCRAAQKKFGHERNISIHCGDSGIILPEILSELREPALFWLDAHHSEGRTARGNRDTPIREELRTILAHSIPGHIIVIDDACDFGSGDYPTISEIRVEAASHGRDTFVANNMIIVKEAAETTPTEDFHSQSGEDTMIARLLDTIGIEHYRCIEFGAWDGLRGSNTARLWRGDKRWRALLVEADAGRYKQLLKNAAGYETVCVNAFVGVTDKNSIDAIARQSAFGPEVDLISIDIDGNDYWIFDSLKFLKPRIVICEYNPTIPPDVRLVGAMGSRIGCSAAALIELAARKGYVLCGATESNLFFILNELTELVADASVPIGKHVEIPKMHLRYLISDYDGNYVFSGPPTYGIRAPLLPSTYQSDFNLVIPHPLLGRIISTYQRIRIMLYHIRRKLVDHA